MGQLAKQLAEMSTGSFVANTEKNPKEECKVTFIRSQRRKNAKRKNRANGVLEDMSNEEGENKKRDKDVEFKKDTTGLIRFKGRICVPPLDDLKVKILEEAHKSRLSFHPGMTKMYQDLKRSFWWHGMKKDVAEYVAKCLTCQKAKAEHQRPSGELKPLEIPEWK